MPDVDECSADVTQTIYTWEKLLAEILKDWLWHNYWQSWFTVSIWICFFVFGLNLILNDDYGVQEPSTKHNGIIGSSNVSSAGVFHIIHSCTIELKLEWLYVWHLHLSLPLFRKIKNKSCSQKNHNQVCWNKLFVHFRNRGCTAELLQLTYNWPTNQYSPGCRCRCVKNYV